MDLVEEVLEDALSAWKDGAELLDSLPSLSPDHETTRIAVANLRAVYEQMVARRPHGASALASSREAITVAKGTLDAVRTRQGSASAGAPGTTIDQIERTIAQAEELLGQMPPYSAEYQRISDAIMQLRQIDAMAGAGPGLGPSDAVIRRSIVEAQRAIAQAADGNGRDRDGRPSR